VPFMRSCGKIW